MKKSIRKTSAITLILTTLAVALVGCGTGADSASMGASASSVASQLK